MKKSRAGASKLAAKRHKAALRRNKASDKIRFKLNADMIIAAWLNTKPKAEWRSLLERHTTYDELLDEIRQDTASHEAMWT